MIHKSNFKLILNYLGATTQFILKQSFFPPAARLN